MKTSATHPPDPGAFDIAFVLLLLQSAFALVSVLGTIAVGAFLGALPAMSILILFGFVGPVVTLVLAVGTVRLRRWARNGTVIYEGLLLIGMALRLFIGRELAFGLVPLLTEIVLPLAVLILLLNRTSRKMLASTRRGTALTRFEQPARLDAAA